MGNEVTIREEARVPEMQSTAILAELTVEQMAAQVAKIQQLMKAVMKEGEHYGVIPGTDKPSLLQPGAQKLTFTFRLADHDVEVIEKELPGNHREYRVHKQIVALVSGQVLAEAWGICSTMETRYRYRNVSDWEDTGEPIPPDSKERKQEYRKQGFGMKKVKGVWLWVRYKDSSRVENPDIADTYNTVLAMADKRAFVRGTIKALAASDLFTHDIEDFTGDDGDAGNGEERKTGQETGTRQASPDIEAYCAKLLTLGFDQKAVENFRALASRVRPDDKESLANLMKAWDTRKPPKKEAENPMAAAVEKLQAEAQKAGKVPPSEVKQGGLPYDHA